MKVLRVPEYLLSNSLRCSQVKWSEMEEKLTRLQQTYDKKHTRQERAAATRLAPTTAPAALHVRVFEKIHWHLHCL